MTERGPMTGTPRTTALTFAFHDHPKPCSLKKSEPRPSD